MPSDGESFGWVSENSEEESSNESPKSSGLKKMVKQEKHSSDDDVRNSPAVSKINSDTSPISKITSPVNNIVRKQEKVTPVKVETNKVNRKSNNFNAENVLEHNVTPFIRNNESVSDNTRRNKVLLDNYIENNTRLTKNTKLSSYEITEEDEIFLLQCPPNIDIDSLLGLEFLDRDKKKFKMGTTPYECVLSNNKNDSKITLMLPPKTNADDYKLHTFNVQGSYLIKERLKRNNDIEVIEETTSAVPFPTNLKQRHPLFGASYKSLIKIAPSVKEKLESPVCKLPKLKKIKEEPMEEVQEDVVTKKTKKRKAECVEDEEYYEPRKKIKKENDMWMTETSIEKNLFDIPVKSKKKSRQSL